MLTGSLAYVRILWAAVLSSSLMGLPMVLAKEKRISLLQK